jgi:predicted SprT family Zn-dependent metalloprotease
MSYTGGNGMTVELLARELGLWAALKRNVGTQAGERAAALLEQLAGLPVRPSRATRSLGSYTSCDGIPVCIRLQFAQEPDNLSQTLLHEIAHVCDHLTRQPGRRYRQAHGAGWQLWARTLGATTQRLGSSENLQRLYQQRIKLVAVCQRCGAKLHRARRLNRQRSYLHVTCGGQLRPV